MKKIGLVILGMVVLLIGIFSLSKKENKVLVEEQINNSNTSLVFMLQDKEGNYNKSEELPISGYSFNTSKSICSNNTTPTWEDNKLYLNNLSKNGTSCYLYFDIKLLAFDTILAEKNIHTRTDFSTILSSDTTGIIYQAEDDDGPTYYFAGNPSDNWVKFARYYWRIIRINGDGSIRMIYAGSDPNITTGSGTRIGTSAFNSSYNNNMYVGYMYESGVVHGLKSNSTIKGVLDDWYKENLSGYADKINKDAGFCGDREPSTSSSNSNGSGGTGTTTTYYGAYMRLVNSTKSPSYKCTNSSDLYTVKGSSKGNKALNYPIGLITADEVAYAGGVYGENNTEYYLYTKQYYWTISPCSFNGSGAVVFGVDSGGRLSSSYMNDSNGVRPVINIASDVTLSGTGTSSDPYVVEGAE